MVYAAIDIHKRVFQAVVVDVDTGEVAQERFPATREALGDWAMRWQGKTAAVAVEATNGWRWVWRQLTEASFDVRLAEAGQARALRGRTRSPKTDRLDARWLCFLLAKQMLPEAWVPPMEIQELRDRTRLRKALAEDRTRWAQRLHALLMHEGWSCERGRLLSKEGKRWVAALQLEPAARSHVDTLLRLIATLEDELEQTEAELCRFAKADRRCQVLMTIYGVGPILACHLLAELGQASRFKRARQVVRAAGLDPLVSESGESKRRGRLAKHGSPQLRWALVEAAHHARHQRAPDGELYADVKRRAGSQAAVLTVARKIGRRAYHSLAQLERQAA
jgi:transposase